MLVCLSITHLFWWRVKCVNVTFVCVRERLVCVVIITWVLMCLVCTQVYGEWAVEHRHVLCMYMDVCLCSLGTEEAWEMIISIKSGMRYHPYPTFLRLRAVRACKHCSYQRNNVHLMLCCYAGESLIRKSIFSARICTIRTRDNKHSPYSSTLTQLLQSGSQHSV